MKLSGKKWEEKVFDKLNTANKELKLKKSNVFAGFGDLIDEVVGIGIDKRFGAPFGDGGTLLHEWSKNS